MYTSQLDGKSVNRGQFVHHPEHARTVKKACDAAGVPAIVWFAQTEPRLEGDYLPALRAFLFKHLEAKAK